MTGRAAGYCAGYAMPGFANAVGGGRGLWGCGRGRGGRGFRNWFYATGLPGPMRGAYAEPVAPEQELQALKQQAASLQDTLNRINERVEQLQSRSNT
jgi:hypothetical protein